MNKKNIAYVFISGRKEKIESLKENYAKEFFYGYQYFEKKGHNMKIIEFDKKKSFFSSVYFILNKLSDLPIYGQNLINKTNYQILKNTDEILFTNQKTAFSMLPLLLFTKINNEINSHVFIMGLFGKNMNYRIKEFFRNIFIRILIISSKNLIFLGIGEYEYALKKYHKYKHKFTYLPFSIDTDFWEYSNLEKVNNELLFIGNDGMRDYDFLEDLIISMPNYTFNVVSKQFNTNKVIKNLRLHKGDWGAYSLSDNFIKKLYQKSSLTLLPIKETYQPSGQSVALQSMSVGTPVMITKTNGFWDKDNFIDNENIYFIDDNNLDKWRESIINKLQNKSSIKEVGINGRDLISEKYGLELFFLKLEDLLLT
jgi:glycosyltransferase involved in cell wall biosynthesis